MGGGVNNGIPSVAIKETQAVDMRNLGSEKFPSMSVKLGRQKVGPVQSGSVNMIGNRMNDKLMTVVGTAWRYWDGTAFQGIATLTGNGPAESVDFMGKTVLVNGTDRKSWDGTTVTDISAIPEGAKYITLHDNRLYCSDGSQTVYFSALRKIDDWSTVNDSGAIVAETSDGSGVTCVRAYNNHVIIGKKKACFELYGNNPSNFELVTISLNIGVVSHRSFKEINKYAYWLSYDGVCEYGGGLAPKVISKNVKGFIDRINWSAISQAVAGTDGTRYYLAIPIDDSSVNNIVLVYDTENKEWYVENGNLVDFVEFNQEFYTIDSNGQLWRMRDGTDEGGIPIAWYRESKLLLEGPISNRRSWYKLHLMIDLPEGSTCKVYISTSDVGEDWEEVADITPSNVKRNVEIRLPMASSYNVSWIRVKFEGTGPCVIDALEKHLRVRR